MTTTNSQRDIMDYPEEVQLTWARTIIDTSAKLFLDQHDKYVQMRITHASAEVLATIDRILFEGRRTKDKTISPYNRKFQIVYTGRKIEEILDQTDHLPLPTQRDLRVEYTTLWNKAKAIQEQQKATIASLSNVDPEQILKDIERLGPPEDPSTHYADDKGWADFIRRNPDYGQAD